MAGIVVADMHPHPSGRRLLAFLPEIARTCLAPLATGGGIRTIEDIHNHLTLGADRVVINTAAFDNPAFIAEVRQSKVELAPLPGPELQALIARQVSASPALRARILALRLRQ